MGSVITATDLRLQLEAIQFQHTPESDAQWNGLYIQLSTVLAERRAIAGYQAQNDPDATALCVLAAIRQMS